MESRKKKTDQRQTKTSPVILHNEWQPTTMRLFQYTRDEHNLAQSFD